MIDYYNIMRKLSTIVERAEGARSEIYQIIQILPDNKPEYHLNVAKNYIDDIVDELQLVRKEFEKSGLYILYPNE